MGMADAATGGAATKSSAKSAKSDAQKYVPSRRDSSPARLSALVTLHLSAKTRDGARA